MQTSQGEKQVADLLLVSLPFSQELVRDHFREYPKAFSRGQDADAARHKKELELLHAAWGMAYPDIPIPAPLPEALHWDMASHRRYAGAQKLTENAHRLLSHGFFNEAQADWLQALSAYQALGATFATAYLYMDLGIRAYEAGELKKAVIKLGKSGLTASDEKALEEANKKLAAVRD